MFDITQKLILTQKYEVKSVSMIEWHVTSWVRSTLLHDRVIKLSKARVHVHSDSVLSGKDASTAVGRGQVERTILTISRNPMNKRAIGVGVEYFPRANYNGTTPRDSVEIGMKRDRTRRLQRSDWLHVDVQ